VILQPGSNDRKRGVGEGERDGNIAQIRSRLAARKIKVVTMGGSLFQSVKRQHLQSDGTHITPEGHAKLAARILPQVLAAIGR
jgi:acyl-CoA thioesterase-1